MKTTIGKRSLVLVGLMLVLLSALSFAQAARDFEHEGKIAFKAGDLDKAIENLNQALKADSTLIEARELLCEAYLESGLHKKSKTECERVLSQDPRNPNAQRFLGDALVQLGDFEGARKAYLSSIELKRKCPECYFGLATAYAKLGMTAEARKTLKDKGASKGDKAYASNAIGTILLAEAQKANDKDKQQKINDAIVSFIRASASKPKISEFQKNLGDAYMEKGVAVLAIDSYTKAVTLNPKNFKARFRLAEAYAKDRRFNEAMGEYKKAMEIAPDFAEPYYEAGNLYYLAKQYPNAAVQLREYTKRAPEDPQGFLYLGKALYYARQREEAKKAFEEAIRLGAKNGDAERYLGLIYFFEGKYDDSLKNFERAAKLAPLAADDLVKVGQMRIVKQEYALAESSLTAAIRSDPALSDAYFELGRAFYFQRRFDQAIPNFEKKVELDTTAVGAYLNLGLCYNEKQNPQKAIDAFVHATRITPNNMQAQLWLAQTYLSQGLLKDAKTRYAAALGIDSTSAEALRGLGYITLLDKECGAAIPLLEKAVLLDPGNVQGLLWMAQGYLVCSTTENQAVYLKKAKDYFNRVLKHDPGNRDAKAALDALKEAEEKADKRRKRFGGG
ncbi:MAG: tetratricopeptide repeat protein [Candidatus Eisenbacteria bacterium]|nr:tetratricopeptide repeat protein [Candidatus Eisenbacteria bacterium]